MKTLYSIILLFLASTFLSAQALKVNELPPSLRVLEQPETLERTLDSASQHSRVPLHAKYFNHESSLANGQKIDGALWWHIPSANFQIQVYLSLHLRLGDSLFVYEESGKLKEVYWQGKSSAEYTITEKVTHGIALRLVQHSAQGSFMHIHGYSLEPIRLDTKSSLDFGDSDFCEINIGCPEGANFQDVEKGIVRISLKIGPFVGWCTGTLVNTTAQDFKPYILTAEHCGQLPSGQFVNASDLAQWQFYFNYRGNNCPNPNSETEVNFRRVVGSQLLARSDDGGGETGSDFALVELTDTTAFKQLLNPYFAGWDRSGTVPLRGVCIHHPEGDIKKISTFNSSAISSEFGNTVTGTHWEVRWSPTATGHGVTEGGSSGSPILTDQGLIKGCLTGGVATCFANTAPDYYGKFSYSWNQNGSVPNRRLQPWLDPAGTGAFVMGGAFRGDSIPPSTPEVELAFAPNPLLDGKLRILNLRDDQLADVYVFSTGGQLVFQQVGITGLPANLDQPVLDLGRLRPGIYYVRLEGPDYIFTDKILIPR